MFGHSYSFDGSTEMRRLTIRALLTFAWICLAPLSTQATVQSPDELQLNGERSWILEHPIEQLWKKSEARPKFDQGSTSNRKGYTAVWEIRDSKLYLVSFDARINKRKFKFRQIVPRAKLPHHATWFTGTLHIPINEKRPGSDYFDLKSERLEILEIKDGEVIHRQEGRKPNHEDQK